MSKACHNYFCFRIRFFNNPVGTGKKFNIFLFCSIPEYRRHKAVIKYFISYLPVLNLTFISENNCFKKIFIVGHIKRRACGKISFILYTGSCSPGRNAVNRNQRGYAGLKVHIKYPVCQCKVEFPFFRLHKIPSQNKPGFFITQFHSTVEVQFSIFSFSVAEDSEG